MPKAGVAAKIISKDAREHRESRKFKVKTQGDEFVNENEILRARSHTRRVLQKSSRRGLLLSVGSKIPLDDSRKDVEDRLTVTH